jgi:hypothetical protein
MMAPTDVEMIDTRVKVIKREAPRNHVIQDPQSVCQSDLLSDRCHTTTSGLQSNVSTQVAGMVPSEFSSIQSKMASYNEPVLKQQSSSRSFGGFQSSNNTEIAPSRR